METRSLRLARNQLEAMDPAIKTYHDKLSSMMEANTAALIAISSKIDDLTSWRPDLEKRVADLSATVTALQKAQPSSSSAPTVVSHLEKGTSPPPVTLGAPIRPEEGAGEAIHGSPDHDGFNLPCGLSVASFMTPPPLPPNGQSNSTSPLPPLSRFTHASQLLVGLG